jgi:hypothetical protein
VPFHCSPPSNGEIPYDQARPIISDRCGQIAPLASKMPNNAAMGSRQLIFANTGTQQCGSCDIKHCVIGSIDRAVGIAILQFARAGQSTRSLCSKIAG